MTTASEVWKQAAGVEAWVDLDELWTDKQFEEAFKRLERISRKKQKAIPPPPGLDSTYDRVFRKPATKKKKPKGKRTK